jgi:Na+-driven multidrug efflux pump
MFILYIPLALAGSHFFGLPGMFTGLSLSFFLASLAAVLLLKKTLEGKTLGALGVRS